MAVAMFNDQYPGIVVDVFSAKDADLLSRIRAEGGASRGDVLLGGSGKFFGVQVLSIVISSIWSFSATIAIFWIVDRITKVRVPASMEAEGLDWGLHEELAETADH